MVVQITGVSHAEKTVPAQRLPSPRLSGDHPEPGRTALTLHEPKRAELWFRQLMLADEATMSYNRAWGGTIPFPEADWDAWYGHWLAAPEGRRFYRYLKNEEGRFVGEIAYHIDGAGRCLADVIVCAKDRGRGYGSLALELLCGAAKENGVEVLWDDIAADNPALGLFLRHGFTEAYRTEAQICLRRVL